ncbi:response regulator [Erythrobacter arachoides]|uniref:Response regulator n=1 Tax=Aurantiacibacter arachoides TaxID=1850444 RepID=A0A844ZZQ1_9SPHN|nr:response regulator [Aurantiacibacter arachoides]MXO92207.1 response regulator [Aurantiacibacter arachoides]GGD58857.1 response regulator [Aurantiacibacter arachoides]
MRALIVEDELLTALHLESELQSLAVQSVGIACDQTEAMALASTPVDLAFVDVNLRDGPTGPAIAAALVALGVEVFYITANPSQIPEACRTLGQIMPKPFSGADLMEAVQRVRSRQLH